MVLGHYLWTLWTIILTLSEMTRAARWREARPPGKPYGFAIGARHAIFMNEVSCESDLFSIRGLDVCGAVLTSFESILDHF